MLLSIMWNVISPVICLLTLLPSHCKMAGGMVHWTNEGVDLSPQGIMRHIAGNSDEDSTAILEKEKAYYAACVDKTLARLALARSRVDAADLTEGERLMLYGRLDSGTAWLNDIKEAFLSAGDRTTFERTIDLKTWHAVKMMPTAAEGFAIACSIEKSIDRAPDRWNKYRAVVVNENARATFLRLLNLTGWADFIEREKDRIEAYGQLSRADDWLKEACA